MSKYLLSWRKGPMGILWSPDTKLSMAWIWLSRRILAKHAQDSWLAPNCKRKKSNSFFIKHHCCWGGEVFDCMKILRDPQRGTLCMPAYAGVSGLAQSSEEFAGKQKVWSLSYDRLWRKWLGVTDCTVPLW